ncbi:protein SAWADEE HOMEODOMAIN HOMOLOG 2-like [Phalaenopsis equestris]|uniref:protein SAWADEE HOMEODOMAIN HOMOLOG 2-like n=1 Tax=Phalaenopsis equestris TaxID=78828 RepID=UPI0009E1F206|nr:protein SAWADEE HOMEODOMAIN HOMOLOG 2-like [Phalaenopsis equestris]
MGRHPHSGGPVFRFMHTEVVEMESCLQILRNAIPAREMICALAEKFSASTARAGKTAVQPKQVWNWFQNRRYSQRAKVKVPVNQTIPPPVTRDDSVQFRNVVQPISIPQGVPQGQNSVEISQLEFEAKSARDGAWYDVSGFLSHRKIETDDPEVRVRFSGFGVEEDEWINVRRCVRQRSLPCENVECVAVLPGDLILCFQEGKEQALYFDAHILDAQRRRHDIRGCRCRFLVRYDHDQSEEIVPLRKVCRRPETDYRLQELQALRKSGSADERALFSAGSLRDPTVIPQRIRKPTKLVEFNTAEITTIALPAPPRVQVSTNISFNLDCNNTSQNDHMSVPVLIVDSFGKVRETVDVVEV